MLAAIPNLFLASLVNNYTYKILVDEYVSVDSASPTNILWNVAQMGLECCGTYGGGDYDEATSFNRTWLKDGVTGSTLKIPPTCCKSSYFETVTTTTGKEKSEVMQSSTLMSPCVYQTTDTASNYNSGCSDALWEKYSQYKWFIVGPFIAVFIILVIFIKNFIFSHF